MKSISKIKKILTKASPLAILPTDFQVQRAFFAENGRLLIILSNE